MFTKMLVSLAFLAVLGWSAVAFDMRYNALGFCSADTFTTLTWNNTVPCTNISLPGATLQTNCQQFIGCLTGKSKAEDFIQCAYATGTSAISVYRIDALANAPGVRLTVYSGNASCETSTGATLTYDVLQTSCYPVVVGGNSCFYSSQPVTSAAAVLSEFSSEWMF